MHKDDEYEIDDRGYRVLIGLTVEETEELFRLDGLLSIPTFYVDGSDDELSPDETRWVELIDKHDAAMKPFRHMRSVKH